MKSGIRKVALAGFDTIVKTKIELQVRPAARVDFTLAVGQATQTIEVAANAALPSTSTPFGRIPQDPVQVMT